jgi:hypothetical protein
MRWSQPYGGGLLAKRRQPNKIVVLAKADAGGGKLQARPEMPRTEPPLLPLRGLSTRQPAQAVPRAAPVQTPGALPGSPARGNGC